MRHAFWLHLSKLVNHFYFFSMKSRYGATSYNSLFANSWRRLTILTISRWWIDGLLLIRGQSQRKNYNDSTCFVDKPAVENKKFSSPRFVYISQRIIIYDVRPSVRLRLETESPSFIVLFFKSSIACNYLEMIVYTTTN